RDESVTIRNELMTASNTIAQRAAIAVKIQHHRLFSARRYMPDEHPLTVLGSERDLLSFREAGHGGRGMQSLRKIHQRALHHIHQRDESAEGGSGYSEPFEQRHGPGDRSLPNDGARE